MPYSAPPASEFERRAAARLVARTDLSDLHPSGQAVQIIGSVAQELARIARAVERLRDARNPARSTGADLAALAAEFGVVPRPATRATCYVVFSRSTTTGSVTVTAGSIVATAAGATYQTTEDVTLLAGEAESDSVLVVATTPGTGGNCAVGAITRCLSVAGGLTVTNVTAADDGAAGSSTRELREAIADVPRTAARCNRTAIIRRALQATSATGQRVRFAKPIYGVESKVGILYVDDGTGGLQAAYAAAPAETLTPSAVGGELLLYTTQRPLRTKPNVYRDGILLAEGVHYTVSRPLGQVRLTSAAEAGEAYTVGEYTVWIGLVAEANRLIYGDATDLETYPPFLAAGDELLVQGAKVQVPAFTAYLTVKAGYPHEAVAAEVKSAWLALINRGDLGARLRDSQLHTAALTVPSRGAEDVDLVDWSDFYPPEDTVLRAAPEDITILKGGA